MAPFLDWVKYPKSINMLLSTKPFFKRFNNIKSTEGIATYSRVLKNAQVRLFKKDQVVFLRGEIGVVTMGSIEIRRHNNKQLLKPYIVKKAVEGDIIGFKEGDDNYTSSPLSWLVCL